MPSSWSQARIPPGHRIIAMETGSLAKWVNLSKQVSGSGATHKR